VHSQMCAEIN